MDKFKKIRKENLFEIATVHGFSKELIIKDFILTQALYFIKDIEGIYFKGGTAIQKTILNHSRLSEDIDFTVTKDVKIVKKEIIKTLQEKSPIFKEINQDKNVDDFTRLTASYNLFESKGEIFLDLNGRAKLITKPRKQKINHFYKPFIPEFEINMLSIDELIAEKIAAAIGRNKPRDHFDIYQIIKNNYKLNKRLAEQKCKDSGYSFSVIKMFSKAKKLKNRWDDDMIPLLSEEIEFQTVIQFLAKHFKLKDQKKKNKKAVHKK